MEIHVRAGAASAAVGGEHDDVLLVRVVEPAGRGRATDAALRAVAEALAMPPSAVTLVRGATSRRKLIDIAVRGTERERVALALRRLRGQAGP